MNKEEFLKSNNIDVEASLEFWGDMDSYNENLLEFKDSLNSKLANLEYYKNNSDWENYGILAHSMKSEAKYLGFMKDAEVFLEHELKGKEGNGEFIKENFKNLEDTVNKIFSLLDKYFATNNTKQTILVADDSSIILNFLENSIGDKFNVIRSNNGKDAIDNIANNDIYAILLDLNMPEVNGFEVLNYLKEQDLIYKIPVVIITGDDTPETIKKAFSYPILDVLNKPFNEENIKRILVSIKSFYEHK